MNISWRAFWIALGASVTAAVGGIPVVIGLPIAVVIVVTVLLGVIVMLCASSLIRRGVGSLRDVPTANRSHIVSMVGFAMVLHIAWVAFLQVYSDWPTVAVWPFALVALAGAEYGVAFTYQWGRENLPAKVPAQAAVVQDETSDKFREALRRSELGSVKVMDWHAVSDAAGRPFGVDFEVQVPSKLAQKGK